VRAVVAAGLIAGFSRVGHAQSTTLRVSGSPAAMRIQGATAGQVAAPAVESSTSYTINNHGTTKITAQLNAPMPTGVTLSATFGAPAGAVSLPNIALDALARDVVTGITAYGTNTAGITYTLSATLDAGVVPIQTRMVTLTVVTAP
jgi:hypothetical protein